MPRVAKREEESISHWNGPFRRFQIVKGSRKGGEGARTPRDAINATTTRVNSTLEVDNGQSETKRRNYPRLVGPVTESWIRRENGIIPGDTLWQAARYQRSMNLPGDLPVIRAFDPIAFGLVFYRRLFSSRGSFFSSSSARGMLDSWIKKKGGESFRRNPSEGGFSLSQWGGWCCSPFFFFFRRDILPWNLLRWTMKTWMIIPKKDRGLQ